MRGEKPNCSRAHSIIAGSVASELCVLAATTCTGAIASRELTCPTRAAHRHEQVHEQAGADDDERHESDVLQQEPCRAKPSLPPDAERQREYAERGDRRAPSARSRPSLPPWRRKKWSMRHVAQHASRVAANPNRTAKITSARIALSAAAAMMFDGSRAWMPSCQPPATAATSRSLRGRCNKVCRGLRVERPQPPGARATAPRQALLTQKAIRETKSPLASRDGPSPTHRRHRRWPTPALQTPADRRSCAAR